MVESFPFGWPAKTQSDNALLNNRGAFSFYASAFHFAISIANFFSFRASCQFITHTDGTINSKHTAKYTKNRTMYAGLTSTAMKEYAMDRISLNVLVFRRVENDLELLTPESLDDEDEAVTAVYLDIPIAA